MPPSAGAVGHTRPLPMHATDRFYSSGSWADGIKKFETSQRTPIEGAAAASRDSRATYLYLREKTKLGTEGVQLAPDPNGGGEAAKPRSAGFRDAPPAKGPLPTGSHKKDEWCDKKPHTAHVEVPKSGCADGMFAVLNARVALPPPAPPPLGEGHNILTNSVREGCEPKPMYGAHGWSIKKHGMTTKEMTAKRDVQYAIAVEKEKASLASFGALRKPANLRGEACYSVRQPVTQEERATTATNLTRSNPIANRPPIENMESSARLHAQRRGFDIVSGKDYPQPAAGGWAGRPVAVEADAPPRKLTGYRGPPGSGGASAPEMAPAAPTKAAGAR